MTLHIDPEPTPPATLWGNSLTIPVELLNDQAYLAARCRELQEATERAIDEAGYRIDHTVDLYEEDVPVYAWKVNGKEYVGSATDYEEECGKAPAKEDIRFVWRRYVTTVVKKETPNG